MESSRHSKSFESTKRYSTKYDPEKSLQLVRSVSNFPDVAIKNDIHFFWEKLQLVSYYSMPQNEISNIPHKESGHRPASILICGYTFNKVLYHECLELPIILKWNVHIHAFPDVERMICSQYRYRNPKSCCNYISFQTSEQTMKGIWIPYLS